MANPEDYTEIPSVLCQSQWNQPFGKNVAFSRLFTLSDSLVNLSMRSTVLQHISLVLAYFGRFNAILINEKRIFFSWG